MAIKEFLPNCVPIEEANRLWVIQIFNFILELKSP